MDKVAHMDISPDQAGQRIDNFLMRHLKGVPRSHIYRILRSGQVRVNRCRVKPVYRIETGDRVRIPPVRSPEGPSRAAPIPRAVQDRLQTCVLHEDDALMVLNKPARLAVHGGSGLGYGVIEALRAARPYTPSLELVHRLDRDTSGCLLVAKNRTALAALHGLLRQGAMDKRYLALVAGRWQGGERVLDASLARVRGGAHPRRVRVDEGGKTARTVLRPRQRFERCTLLQVALHTGRTHQIRVHAASAGYPLAGDDKYGDLGFNREMRDLGLRRLFLHAHRVRFRMPGTGRRYDFEAPLDLELAQVLERLDGT
jgi:23S rRNA pseudouridine955/2504/2580 synthase